MYTIPQCKSGGARAEKRGGGGGGNPAVAACCVSRSPRRATLFCRILAREVRGSAGEHFKTKGRDNKWVKPFKPETP